MAKLLKRLGGAGRKHNLAFQAAEDILGKHPSKELFGSYTDAEDGPTSSAVPHRSLTQGADNRGRTIKQLRTALIEHHVSAEMIARDQRKIENLRAQGYPITDANQRFPTADNTRKGNLAEVFLAEYICAASGTDLPVYRLRYNPNVEQSMKGDDVLAFDFSSTRPRIIVGESKFRGTPSKKAVQEIVSGLIRSHQSGLPASLQFVADRLYEAHNKVLANRIENCSLYMAKGILDLSYVGLLLGNTYCKSRVDDHTEGTLSNLVMISFGIENPEQLIYNCFDGIEEEAYDDSE